MVAFYWLCIGVILSWGEFEMSTFLKGAIAAEQICDLTNRGSRKRSRIQSLVATTGISRIINQQTLIYIVMGWSYACLICVFVYYHPSIPQHPPRKPINALATPLSNRIIMIRTATTMPYSNYGYYWFNLFQFNSLLLFFYNLPFQFFISFQFIIVCLVFS